MNNKNTNPPILKLRELLRSPIPYFAISAAFIAYTPGQGFDPMVATTALVGFMLWQSVFEWGIAAWAKRKQLKELQAKNERQAQQLAHELALLRKDVENLELKMALLSSEVEKLRLEMCNTWLSLRCMWLESKLRRSKTRRALPDESNVVEGTTSWVDEDDPRNTMKNRT